MESSIIRNLKQEIPLSPEEDFHDSVAGWENTDNGACIRAARHQLPSLNLEMLIIAVTGGQLEKQRVRSEFVSALGQPVIIDDTLNTSAITAWVYPASPR